MNRMLCLVAISLVAHQARPIAAAPNIVLILTDDQGWSQLSESNVLTLANGASK